MGIRILPFPMHISEVFLKSFTDDPNTTNEAYKSLYRVHEHRIIPRRQNKLWRLTNYKHDNTHVVCIIFVNIWISLSRKWPFKCY